MTGVLAPRRFRLARSGRTISASYGRNYVLSRIGQAIVAAVLVYVLVFVIVTILPGDPVEARLRNPEAGYTEQQVQDLLAYYHLNRPVWSQLWYALQRLLFHADWGLSLDAGRPVWAVVLSGLPSTLGLAAAAFGIALVLAFAISLGACYLPARFGGGVLRAFPSLFLSAPNFLIGLLVIAVFSFRLRWFSIVDYSAVSTLIYPAITLAVPVSAPIAQIFISALDGARYEQYSTVAVAKGISRYTLFVRHWLPNAALPTLTISAIIVGDLLGGSIITEAVFGRTGLGKVIETAATDQDVPVLQAVVTLAALIFLAINLVVDLVYPVLDPRLRRAGAAR
ncbi:ABC transporter permease [Tsukamurella sp. 8F]|uniref:ABC transporter permease n=1 Tax=Tsukamurella sp. 8F TaxID=3031961 RepID=UPI0023B98028|nr:ABC transporter permease [Tsukamurella sp. 8F]MDF0586061.1 ABC transporter permease [Tsukamurella sp. 8F]